MKIRKNKQSLLILAIVMLPMSLSLELNMGNPAIGYCDELLTLIMAMYAMILFAKRNLYKADSNIVILMMFFTIYGLISNIFSGLAYSWMSVFIDALLQWKIFVGFIAGKYIALNYDDEYVADSLETLCKIMLVVGALCGFVSLFVDIGMASYSADQRYGIPAYYFVFGNSGRYGAIVGCELLFILWKNRGENVRTYELLALINMLLTTKGAVYIIFVTYIVLQILFRKLNKNQEIDIKTIIPLGIAGVATSSYQITSYLLDEKAPRALLIRYGFKTANSYFPFGSGFATYGSSEAVKHYSKLYELYGWANKWAMGKQNGDALNDNYLATIIGEAGYVGLFIFIGLFVNIFRQINAIKCDVKSKAMIMSIYIDMLVCFLATGITKSSIGMMVFVIMGYFCGLSKGKEIEYDS